MPELPEVETVRRALEPLLVGRGLAAFAGSGLPLRAPVPLAELTRELKGRKVAAVRRRAKFLLIETDGARALILHLGMSGSLSLTPAAAPPAKHDHLRITLDDGNALRFNDPRRFGLVAARRLDAPGGEPVDFAVFGPEPLTPGFSGKWLHGTTRGRRRPVKPLLLEQDFIAGIGNIYACEALFMAGIDPRRAAETLTAGECALLAGALKKVLRAAIRGGGTTAHTYRALNGRKGSFQEKLGVYDRAGQPCPACGAPIGLIRQSGRSTFYCAVCQK